MWQMNNNPVYLSKMLAIIIIFVLEIMKMKLSL